MQNGLIYILQSLLDLYLLIFVLRLGMHWVRSNDRNPFVQFVLKITDPLVVPVRRFISPIYKLDTATLLIFLILEWAAAGLLTPLVCAAVPNLASMLGLAVISGVRLILNVYTFVLFGYVLLSWISQGTYNPSLAIIGGLLRELAEPLLAPVRRFIPPIAGFDLSPIFLLIGLQALAQTLITPAGRIAGKYLCDLSTII